MKPAPPRVSTPTKSEYEYLFRRAQDIIEFSMPNDAESEVLRVLMKKAMHNGNPIFRETMAVIAEALIFETVNLSRIGKL